ncbi:hypothetical protein SISNIDRAFT_490709 [Sistotremastrum niveocremeum HHB9708]|nr:hypothetical protein SISNIDRAFT_490709 [Sistotremastrum niveocremeum HHB9708]
MPPQRSDTPEVQRTGDFRPLNCKSTRFSEIEVDLLESLNEKQSQTPAKRVRQLGNVATAQGKQSLIQEQRLTTGGEATPQIVSDQQCPRSSSPSSPPPSSVRGDLDPNPCNSSGFGNEPPHYSLKAQVEVFRTAGSDQLTSMLEEIKRLKSDVTNLKEGNIILDNTVQFLYTHMKNILGNDPIDLLSRPCFQD